MTLPQRHEAPALARRFTVAACVAAGMGDACDTAALLVSEVVTNAVVHGRSSPRLTVSTGDGGVRVEVGDSSPALPGQTDALDEDDSGRGLSILDTCAHAWGWRATPQGKVVWFIVRTDGRERPT